MFASDAGSAAAWHSGFAGISRRLLRYAAGMMTVLVTGPAAAQDSPHPDDIYADRTIEAPVAAVFAHLQSPARIASLFPSDCASDWEFDGPNEGLGARVRNTYHAGAMHRDLDGMLTRTEPEWIVELHYNGLRGFTTHFLLEPAQIGGTEPTKVRLITYIGAPPWPFKGHFYKRVKPDWKDCYQRVLQQLDVVMQP